MVWTKVRVVVFVGVGLIGFGGVAASLSLTSDAAVLVALVLVWLMWLASLIIGYGISAQIGWSLWAFSGAVGAATVTADLADNVSPLSLVGLIAATILAAGLSALSMNRDINRISQSKKLD